MPSLLILGRQPELSLAEVESLYGASKLRRVGSEAVVVEVDPCLLAFDRLGGALKFAKVLTSIDSVDWEQIGAFLTQNGPPQSRQMPPGKMRLGISTYGFSRTPKQVQQLALALKQAVRLTGRSVRVSPNNERDLTSAQVIHGQLTGPNGWELLLVKDGPRTVIAQTVKVQDIAGYARRDQRRPARDAKVGMLPPKLAQIIINLATGRLPADAAQSVCEIPPDQPIPKTHFKDTLVLDPFCGSGVILQEAAIMGYDCVGSDIDPRMVDFAKTNLAWLRALPKSPLDSRVSLEVMLRDATTDQWPITRPLKLFVASETNLGKPFAAPPSMGQIDFESKRIQQTLTAFLSNLGHYAESGTRICLAVPAWRSSSGDLVRLPLLDSTGVSGYNRVSFQLVGNEQLIYYRPNQVVARELLVLTKD